MKPPKRPRPDLRSTDLRVYQAPFPGARRRFSRRQAFADWAHRLVSSHFDRRCSCGFGSGLCSGHRAIEAHRKALDVEGDYSIAAAPEGSEAYFGDPVADAKPLEPRGVFNPEVRHGMRRRLLAMLLGGWRPSESLTDELEEARADKRRGVGE